jgi:hypothetical protein
MVGLKVASLPIESLSPLRFGESRVAFAPPFTLEASNPYFSRTFAVMPDGKRILAAAG